MPQIGLIFTTDYEIFGNGTGCVEQCIIKPTEQMAAILERYGARLTVFFEVCEYWAFEKEYAAGRLKKDWAGMMRKQARDLLLRGHDVQLHFHPQWLDYSYDGQSWKLNYDLWRIGSLPYENEAFPERGLKNLFARGKATLEEILQPVKAAYRCEIFRAGAWSIQPEREVLRAMRENGFRLESTVCPGLKFKDDLTYYDFTEAPVDQPLYAIKNAVDKVTNGGEIYEVPIFTAKVNIGRRLYFMGLRFCRKVPFRPAHCRGLAMATDGKSKWIKIREWLAQPLLMSNFGDAVVAEQMIYLTRKAMRRGTGNGRPLPMVWISHPKTFANEGELEQFLNFARYHKELSFMNLGEVKNGR